jgi:hypothetical protein
MFSSAVSCWIDSVALEYSAMFCTKRRETLLSLTFIATTTAIAEIALQQFGF